MFEVGTEYIVKATDKGLEIIDEFDHERYLDIEHDDIDLLTDREKENIIMQAKSYVDCQQCKYHQNPSYTRCKKCEETNGGEYEVQNIIVKPIGYKDCHMAMMCMWLNEIVTDSQYYKIMDKLNAKHEEGLI